VTWLIQRGDKADPVIAVDKEVGGITGKPKPSSARAYAVSNKRNEGVKIQHDLKTGSTRNASEIALMYVGRGEKDQTMRWLEKAYAEHFQWGNYRKGGDTRGNGHHDGRSKDDGAKGT